MITTVPRSRDLAKAGLCGVCGHKVEDGNKGKHFLLKFQAFDGEHQTISELCEGCQWDIEAEGMSCVECDENGKPK